MFPQDIAILELLRDKGAKEKEKISLVAETEELVEEICTVVVYL